MAFRSRGDCFISQCPRTKRPSSLLEDEGMNKGREEICDLQKMLQLETENIIRWKASAEVNSKQLEMQLEERHEMVTGLRGNLMELQLANENLSQNLFREEEERRHLERKMMHSRDMMSSLQHQCSGLEETLGKQYQEKGYLFNVQEETIGRLNDLADNFNKLSILSEQKLKEKEEKQKIILDKAQQDILNLEKIRQALENSYSESCSENRQLKQSLSEQTEKVCLLDDRLVNIYSEAKEAEERSSQLKTEVDKVHSLLSDSMQDYETLKSEKEKLIEELQEQQFKLKESKIEFQEAVEKIKFLKTSSDVLEGANGELSEKLDLVTSQKYDLEKDLSLKGNIIEHQQHDNKELLSEIERIKDSMNEVTSELSVKENEIRHLMSQVDAGKSRSAEEQESIRELQCEVMEKDEQILKDKETLQMCKENSIALQEQNVQLEQKYLELEVKQKHTECEQLTRYTTLKEENRLLEDDLEKERLGKEKLEEELKKERQTLKMLQDDTDFKIQMLKEEMQKSIYEHKEQNVQLEQKYLELEVKQKHTECEQLTRYTTLKEENRLLEDALVKERLGKEKLEEELKKERQTLKMLQDDTDFKIQMLKEEMQKSIYEHKNEICSLMSQVDAGKSSLTEEQASVGKLQSEVMEKDEQILQDKETLEKCKENLIALQEQNVQLEQKYLELEVKQKHTECEQLTRYTTLKEENRLLEDDLEKERLGKEKLEEELKKERQTLKMLQDDTDFKIQTLQEEMQKSMNEYKTRADLLEEEKENTIQEKLQLERETTQREQNIEADAEDKIKGMADLLARYKIDYDSKLTDAQLKIENLESRLQIANICKACKHSENDIIAQYLGGDGSEIPFSPKYSFEIATTHRNMTGTPTTSRIAAVTPSTPWNKVETPMKPRMTCLTPTTPRNVSGILGVNGIPVPMSVNRFASATPSPITCMQSDDTFVFLQPKAPKTPSINVSQENVIAQSHTDTTGILKSKRTLLPSAQKHVVFKLPSPSGNSSSDACSYEVIDSDDPFDEVLCSGNNRRILKSKTNIKPQAHVPPMRISPKSLKMSNPVDFNTCDKPSKSVARDPARAYNCPRTRRIRVERKRKQDVKVYSVKKSPSAVRKSCMENLPPDANSDSHTAV